MFKDVAWRGAWRFVLRCNSCGRISGLEYNGADKVCLKCGKVGVYEPGVARKVRRWKDFWGLFLWDQYREWEFESGDHIRIPLEDFPKGLSPSFCKWAGGNRRFCSESIWYQSSEGKWCLFAAKSRSDGLWNRTVNYPNPGFLSSFPYASHPLPPLSGELIEEDDVRLLLADSVELYGLEIEYSLV